MGLFLILLIIIVVAVVAAILMKWLLPSKGEVGEKRVASLLSKLPQEEYKVINNLLINNKGQTTQIDHVVVSEYRIFVVETKFYREYIWWRKQRILDSKYLWK